jgi:hypothetical protein
MGAEEGVEVFFAEARGSGVVMVWLEPELEREVRAV